MVIVLDTEPFEAALFQLESGVLKQLRDEADKRRASIALTDVQVHEVRSHLISEIDEVKKVATALAAHGGKRSIRRIGTDASDGGTPLPRLLGHTEIRKAIDQLAAAADAASAAFERFITSKNVVVIPCGHVLASRLLPNYFDGIAPFGPGRKKDEFPDAIAIEALKDFAGQSNGAQIIVVSGDPDWKNALSGGAAFEFYPNAREALQYLRNLDATAESIKRVQLGQETLLSEAAAEEFPEIGFTLDEDWGADIEDVEVFSTRVTRIDVTSLQNHVATVEFEVDVIFTCQAQWPDDEYTHWQRSYQVASIQTHTQVDGQAELLLTDDDADIDEIRGLSLDGPLRVSLDDAKEIRSKSWNRNYGDSDV